MGVNWVSIHPYARVRGDGAVGWSVDPAESPEWLTRPIEEAHRLGMKIMIIPHLAHWGSPFSWKGDIGFDDAASWRRFFDSYEEWILQVASICRDADGFSVGCELDRTTAFESEWRRIIGGVRSRTAAPLTFASNWTDYRRVPFWDALDVIGIQAYFPLVAHDRAPTEREVADAWRRIMSELRAFARSNDRRIVFTELGYDRSTKAAKEPWASSRRRDRSGSEPEADAELVQLRCLDAALRAIDRDDVVVGAFLWKWFPGETSRGDFRMSADGPAEVITGRWSVAEPDAASAVAP